MKKIIINLSTCFFTLFSFLLSTENSCAKSILVSNVDELSNAVTAAAPGDQIIMSNGEWEDVFINLNRAGTASAPLLLRAQTGGKVELTGSSRLVFSAPYVKVDGLTFSGNTTLTKDVVRFESHHCTLDNVAIVNYNPAEETTRYYWIYIKGSYNSVVNSYFEGKNNDNPLIGNDDNNSRFNRVVRCHFKDIPYKNVNGREILRIWGYGHNDEESNDGAFFTVEYNLFERAHGEGTEIISLKSNHNMVRYNTIIASKGGIVSRRGNNNLIEYNVILGQGVERTAGIRVSAANHRIQNNYIKDVEGDGIRLTVGECMTPLTDKYRVFKIRGTAGKIPMYKEVKNCVITNNVLDCCGGKNINIGYLYKSEWPLRQLILLPEENYFINNKIVGNNPRELEVVELDRTAPLDKYTEFKDNYVLHDNTVTEVSLTPLTANEVGPVWKRSRFTVE